MTTLSPKQTFSRIGFALLAGTAVSVLLSLLVLTPLAASDTLQRIFDRFGPSVLLLLIYVPQIAFLLVFWLIVRKLPKTAWQTEKLRFGELLMIFVMMYAVSGVFNQIGAAISRAAPVGGTPALDMIGDIVGSGLAMGVLIVTLFAPILEEMIFRKLMIDRLHAYGERNAILFSALSFGLFHGNLTQFLFAASVGLFLGYVYCKTGKVRITILMHILLNAFSSAIMLLVPRLSENGESMETLTALLFIVSLLLVAGMFVAGLILLIRYLAKNRFRLDDSMPSAIPRAEVLRTVYLNPGVALLFVFSTAGIVTGLLNISLPIGSL